MSIWHREGITTADIEHRSPGTMSAHMGVTFVAIGPDYLQAQMPVDARSRQYMGILHGGASAFLAENVASVAANMVVDPRTQVCVGLELNANHLRPIRQGPVTATARPLHLGKTTQVWDVRIEDPSGALCCVARMTMAVRNRAALGLPPADTTS